MLQQNCPQCGYTTGSAAGVQYCPRCGVALPRPLAGGLGEAVMPGGTTLRSVGLAYGLWALCLLGPAGIHRFYAGKYITGIIWLLTLGLLGIGSLIDLFLIPGMIENANRKAFAEGRVSPS